jgi:glyoxylase-like metal-dependent hydrolase (beta-lactamase superfamily II)
MKWTIHRFTFNPFSENTYVLITPEKNAFLIDPGCSDSGENEILNHFIAEQGITVHSILLTHAHIDHILGCHYFSNKLNVPVYLHKEDEYNLKMAPRAAMMYGVNYTPFENAYYFEDNQDEIVLNQSKLNILFTPGHSKGSVCFYAAHDGFLIGGDVLFRESIGRTDLPGGDLPALEKSIQSKIYTLPEQVVVWPGHGAETTVGHEKKKNPFVRE